MLLNLISMGYYCEFIPVYTALEIKKSMDLIQLIIFSITIIQISSERCERTQIGDEFYKRQLIASIDGYPTEMAVDPATDNVYFRLHKKNYTKGIYVLKYGSLGIKRLPISDEFIGQCIAVDSNSNIFIGTNQGMLKIDENKNDINSDRPIGDDDIRNIFFDKSDQMYITVGHGYDIYKFLNASSAIKRFEKLPKAYNFVIDSKDNLFFEYIDGKVYFLSSTLFEPVEYKGLSRELAYIIKLNNHDTAIIAIKGSLYKLTIDNILPVKLCDFFFKITGIVFDNKNNIIVGTNGKIYRYKLMDKNDPCPNDDYYLSHI